MSTEIAAQSQATQPEITTSNPEGFQEVPITKDETHEYSISTASTTPMSSSVADEELSFTYDNNDDDDDDSLEDSDELDVQELLDMYDTIDTIQVGRELAEKKILGQKQPSDSSMKRVDSSVSLSASFKEVRFSTVSVREYPIELGDNPSGESGPPITIGWEHTRETEVTVDHNEEYGYDADEKAVAASDKKKKRTKRDANSLHLSHLKRMCKLHHSGYTHKEIGAATKAANQERKKREETLKSLKNEKLNEYKETIKRAIRNATVDRKAKKAEKEFLKPYVERSSKNRHSSIINESGELPNAKTYEDEGGFWYY